MGGRLEGDMNLSLQRLRQQGDNTLQEHAVPPLPASSLMLQIKTEEAKVRWKGREQQEAPYSNLFRNDFSNSHMPVSSHKSRNLRELGAIIATGKF